MIQKERRAGYVAGVLGGMGPLASTAFVQTIYNLHRGQLEQSAPYVVLISNPAIEDRTAAFLGGHGDVSVLERGIERLLANGASEVFICCFTMHHLLPQVRAPLRAHVVSLLDAALDEMARTPGRMLLACSTGSRELGLFDRHPRFGAVASRVALTSADEQRRLHEGIYEVKRNHVTAPLERTLGEIAERHGVSRIVAGCTELHLLAPGYAGQTEFNQRFEIVDPLTTLARRIREQTNETTLRA
jgi:aspartate racemase